MEGRSSSSSLPSRHEMISTSFGSSSAATQTPHPSLFSSAGGGGGSSGPLLLSEAAGKEDLVFCGYECESEVGIVAPEEPDKAPPPRASGSKRSRAAEVHNLSEKRRRSRINEKIKALQSLIPNSNKTDKASMLDEAIEYLKHLQLQVQMLSPRNGLGLHPMFLPTSQDSGRGSFDPLNHSVSTQQQPMNVANLDSFHLHVLSGGILSECVAARRQTEARHASTKHGW